MNQEIVKPKKIGRWKRGWLMIASAWKVFKLDKELSLFALISGFLGFFIIIAAVVSSILVSINIDSHSRWNWVVWVIAMGIMSLLSTYSAAAIMAGALARFRGEDPSFRSCFRAVRKRWGSLTIFGILNAGVGQTLSWLEEHIPFVGGRIVAMLASLAWSVASLFAITVIVDSQEKVYPIKAIKKSSGIVRKAWGETIVGNFGLGLIFLTAILIEFVGGMALSIFIGLTFHTGFAAILGLVTVLGALVLLVLSSVLGAIVKAALYHYATTGEAPEHFNRELVRQAFTPRKARKLFV